MLDKARQYNILLASGVVVLTSVVVCVVYFQSFQRKYSEYKALNTQLISQTQRYKKLDDTTSLVGEYRKEFERYQPVERFAVEDRLQWLDALDTIRVKNRIPTLTYTIGARKPYDYKDGLIRLKGLEIYVSDVKLNMKLLHAADLVAIFNDLKKIQSTVHVVNSCELKRTSRNRSAGDVNIDAECHARWFTFRLKS